MENDISMNKTNQIEIDTTTINLGIDNMNTNTEKSNAKKHKKKKNKIFQKNVDIIKFPEDNLSNFNQDNSYYKFVGKSIFLFFNKNDDPLLIIGPDWLFVAFLFSLFNFFYIMIIIKFWIIFLFIVNVLIK